MVPRWWYFSNSEFSVSSRWNCEFSKEDQRRSEQHRILQKIKCKSHHFSSFLYFSFKMMFSTFHFFIVSNDETLFDVDADQFNQTSGCWSSLNCRGNETWKNQETPNEMYLPSILLSFISFFFQGCRITSEGMKALSSFLSQDGIVLEELNLSLKEKKKHHISISTRLEQIWRWGFRSSCWRIEKEQTTEKIKCCKYFFKQYFLVNHF